MKRLRNGNATIINAAILSLILLILGVLPSQLRAADPVTLENARAIAPQRFGGPLYLTGELHYHQPGLLECRLQYRVVSNGSGITLIESDPKMLTAGITRFREMLPVLPSTVVFQGGMSEIEVRLVSKTQDYTLRRIPVRLASAGDEPYVLLQVHSDLDSDAALEEARKPLALSNAENVVGPRPFFSPTLVAGELPELSLAYCAFDGVAITPRGFVDLRGRQLDALSEWVRAGGSVCIYLDDETPLEPKHQEFLNQLFRDADRPPWLLDEEGRLQSADLAEGVLADQTGLGFAIVAARDPSWQERSWRETVGRFWHLGMEQVDRLRRTDPASADAGGLTLQEYYRAFREQGGMMSGPTMTFTYSIPPIGSTVFEELRPDDVRLLPGWMLAGILMIYVLMVGPVDYLMLGWFKKRRWTWLTFPLVTVALTAGLVGMANAFMGQAMEARTVTIVDCDANGEPVRVNRLEFLFENLSREFVHDQEAATFSRLDAAYFNTSPQVYLNRGVLMGRGMNTGNPWEQTTIENDAPTGPYRGTYPSQYTVSQQVGKWTPQINRMMTLAPNINIPEIDWEAAARLETNSIELPDGRAARVLHVAGSPPSRNGRRISQEEMAGRFSFGGAILLGSSQNDAYENPGELGCLITVRAKDAPGRSPLGLGRLDDLPLVDPQNLDSRAVVIEVLEADGGITFYRKPIRGKNSEDSE